MSPNLVSIVVPAYNEAGRIGESLRRIAGYADAKGLSVEIIVVDDGSADGTAEVVDGLAARDHRVRLVRNLTNLGKGGAVRRGVKASVGEWVLFSDADLSTPIEELEKLVPWLQSNDLVIASRSAPGADVMVHQPRYRELMGRAFNLVVRALLVRGMIDTQCGFKLMTRRAADQIFARQRIDSFSFDVEMILVAKRLGMAVKEVPVRWVNSPASRVHPVLDSAEMLLDLLLIKAYDILGFYGRPSRRE
ncbi:MAG: dolichyl-phosphate beta-glucosyltransferase [bacterium]